MKKTPLILLGLFLMTSVSLFAQPQLTMWRVFDDGQGNHNHTTEPEFAACGSLYYSIVEEGETTATTFWSIKNEGDENLELDLPLSINGSTSAYTITQQPDKSVLEPGEETHFTLVYSETAGDLNESLQVFSNDPSNRSCELRLEGGTLFPIRDAYCVCNLQGDIEQRGNIVWMPGGLILLQFGEVLLKPGFCAPEYTVGASCREGLPVFPRGRLLGFAAILLIGSLYFSKRYFFNT